MQTKGKSYFKFIEGCVLPIQYACYSLSVHRKRAGVRVETKKQYTFVIP